MAHAAHIVVYDHCAVAAHNEVVPAPQLVMSLDNGKLLWPTADDPDALARTRSGQNLARGHAAPCLLRLP